MNSTEGSSLRVAIAGRTGAGGYGHQLDHAFVGVDGAVIVAVSDPDPGGRAAALVRTGAARGYADLESLLSFESPDIVVIAPRHVDCHEKMVLDALDAGAHVLCEKPLTQDLGQADRIVARAEAQGRRLAVALPWAHETRARTVTAMLADGAIGRLLTMRAHTKWDHRGGGEDFLVLGLHFVDMMRRFAGEPSSCQAWIWDGGRPAAPSAVRNGGEGIGPVLGDRILATYTFASGVMGSVESVQLGINDRNRQPYCLYLDGTEGVLRIRAPYADHSVWYLPEPSWRPDGKTWERIATEPVHTYGAYHRPAAEDLIAAIRDSRDPLCSGHDGRTALEMALAAYASHLAGGPVLLPLSSRTHPLAEAVALEESRV